MFLTCEGVIVRAGCFLGNAKKFMESVEKNKDGWERESYLAFLKIAESKFEELKNIVDGENEDLNAG